MKVTSVLFLFATFVAVNSYPAKNDEAKPKEEVDFVPLESQRPGKQPVVDVEAGDYPFMYNPFPEIFGSLGSMLARMRQQLNQILGRLPTKPDDVAAFPDFNIPRFGDVDLGKGNTTSVTKIINGHKVTINETTYAHEGDDSGAFFNIKIVDIAQQDPQGTEKDSETITSLPKREKEPIEKTVDNEISKNKEELNNFENIETFDDMDSLLPQDLEEVIKHPEWNDVESFEDNSIQNYGGPHPIDLSNDIYVNELMADAGAPTNPDAELFDVVEEPAPVPAILTQGKSQKIVPLT